MDIRFTLDQLPQVVQQFWDTYGSRRIFAFDGAMGAGKTTFVHSLCEMLGVMDPVSSPTFSIINQYKTAEGKDFFHVDLYRIKDEEEAIAVGMEELIYGGEICFIEWPRIIKNLLPDDTCWIALNALSENERQLLVR
jgi:tRNA threonylcarbamoyladenosine biosynthesis protein TsaE